VIRALGERAPAPNYAGTGDILSETVAVTSSKTVASVTLPPGGAQAVHQMSVIRIST
jgi:hypothetical protein